MKREGKASTNVQCKKPNTMKFLKIKFLNASIFTKILFSTMLLIIVPLVLVCLFTYYKITDISHKEFSAYSLETTKQLSSNIDFFWGEMDKTTQIVASNTDLQDSLSRSDNNIEYKTLRTISDFINNIMSSRMEDMTLIIAGKNGDLYYNSEYYNTRSAFPEYLSKPFLNYNFLDNSLINELNNSRQRRIFTGLTKPPYRDTSDNYYMIVREIVNRYSGSVLGYVYLDIPYSTINDLITTPENQSQSDILIIKDQEIIFSKNPDLLHTNISDSSWKHLTSGSNGTKNGITTDSDSFYTYCTIPTTEWKVVFYIPEKLLTKLPHAFLFTILQLLPYVLFSPF